LTSPIFGVVGWKNSGKTTLLTRIIENFASRGLSVAAVKHAHHAFDIDHEGRDSFRYRAVGASTVAVSSAKRFAIITELRDRPEPSLGELIRHIECADIILVEGFKSEKHPKLEVRRRQALSQTALAPQDPAILAVAADYVIAESHLPVFELDDIETIAAFILDRVTASLRRSELEQLGPENNRS
jgi:molybdopterin-guanine dinucleotide biosynthesis protein B